MATNSLSDLFPKVPNLGLTEDFNFNGPSKKPAAKRGGRKPYKIGYAFECMVRKRLERLGFKVERKHKSRFPDLIAMPKVNQKRMYGKAQKLMGDLHQNLIIECKVNKHIRSDEREKFKAYEGYGRLLIAYPLPNPMRKGTKLVVFCDLDYKDVMVLSP